MRRRPLSEILRSTDERQQRTDELLAWLENLRGFRPPPRPHLRLAVDNTKAAEKPNP